MRPHPMGHRRRGTKDLSSKSHMSMEMLPALRTASEMKSFAFVGLHCTARIITVAAAFLDEKLPFFVLVDLPPTPPPLPPSGRSKGDAANPAEKTGPSLDTEAFFSVVRRYSPTGWGR